METLEEGRDAESSLDTFLFETVEKDMLETLTSKGDPGTPKIVVLDLAALQRLEMYKIQWKIAETVKVMCKDRKVTDERYPQHDARQLGSLLHTYRTKLLLNNCFGFQLIITGDAVRHLEYIEQFNQRGYDKHPFLMNSFREIERTIMEKTGLIAEYMNPRGNSRLPIAEDYGNPLHFGLLRSAANRDAARQRLSMRVFMAFGGVIASYAPMLIMVLIRGRISSLATTFAFMIAFAVVIVRKFDLRPIKIFGAAAAYAAVLVVFFGVSLTA